MQIFATCHMLAVVAVVLFRIEHIVGCHERQLNPDRFSLVHFGTVRVSGVNPIAAVSSSLIY